MIVKFADLDCMSPPTLILRNLDGTPIQTLGYAFGVELDLNYNEVSTISFQLPKYVDGEKTPHYDEVVGMRIVDVLGVGRFILVDPQESNDDPKCIKSCKAYSLEYEFAKKNIYLEGGTYNFFDGLDTHNPDTIIGRILERMPDWTADIDEALIGKYRTFDDLNKKVYDFIKSDIQQKYGCIFDFETYTRTIRVRSVETPVSQKPIYLSQDALIKKLDVNEDSESIVTCLDVYGADGVDIRSVNPTGTNKIYNLDYFMNTVNFSQEMIDKWHMWESAVDAAQETYYQITISYNLKLVEILTAQAELEDLNTELQILINERATTISYMHTYPTLPPGVRSLMQINADISAKEAEISSQSAVIETMKSDALDIDAQRIAINESLAFSEFFTEDEVQILNRYFIEDTMEDNSFVMRNAITYNPAELNVNLSTGSSSTLTVPVNPSNDGYQYRCIVTSGGTSLTSEPATLRMISGNLFAITDHPASISAHDFDRVGYHVAASGENITYQWQYKAVSGTWNNIDGYTEDTLSFIVPALYDGYQYRCLVTSGGVTLESEPASMTIVSGDSFYIAKHPHSVARQSGDTARFSVDVGNGSNVTYQWQYKAPNGEWQNCNSVFSVDSPYESVTEGDMTTYSFAGGSVTVSTLQAKIISATMTYNAASRNIVFTAYLNDGTVGSAAFESGNLTVSGTGSVSGDGTSAQISIENGRLYFTENATEYERHQIEWELYDHAKTVLYEHAGPTYNFTVDAVNFLALRDYILFHNALTLGERVYLNLDEQILTPYVVHVHLSYDSPDDFQIEFSSTYTSFDQSFALAKLLDQSVSMGKTLDYKSGMYSAFVNSGASSSVKTFMDSALDVAKNHVLSSGQQAITYDDTGIRVRKWADDAHDTYDPEEIWMVNNMMVFTNNSWESAKMAIGKIFDPNLQGTYHKTDDAERKPDKTYYTDTNGTQWDPEGSVPWSTELYELNADGLAYGVAAPYLVGTMIAGQNLIIDSVKPDGTNSVFRVDGSGASLYNASFTVTDNYRDVVMNPTLGFGIGVHPIVVQDQQTGEDIWNETNTKFWADTNGDVYFAGTLQGATGVFSGELKVGGSGDPYNFWVSDNGYLRVGPYGVWNPNNPTYNFEVDPYGNVKANNGTFGGVLKAKDIQMPDGYGGWTSILTNRDPYTGESTANSKVGPDYLELKGLSVMDYSDPYNPRTTFRVDGVTGNVTMSGSILANGDISASTITASTMRGGRVEGASFFVTGEGRLNETAYYICNQYENPLDPSAPLSPTYIDGWEPYKIGYLSFDTQPTPDTKYSAKYRVLLKTTGVYRRTVDTEYPYSIRGLALKLESTGDISLSAGVDRKPEAAPYMEEGSIILASRVRLTTASFGSTAPGTAVSNPAEGQIYFQTAS